MKPTAMNRTTLKIGITGGIGSGKTTVCNVFRLLGIPVFEADAAARQLMNEDEGLRNDLIAHFGKTVYHSDGKLNREQLAGILFNDNRQREKVNALVHPAVHAAFFRWCKANSSFPYLIYEAAILFEGGFQEKLDFTILVTAPEEERVRRVMKRNKMTEALVRERIKSQMPEEEKRKLADRCLLNDDKKLILPEIVAIDKKLRTYGTIW